MKLPDPDHDEKFSGVLRGLEQIGRQLDAQKYPGRAWSEIQPPHRGPVLWKIAAAVAALAAGIVLAVCLWPVGGLATPAGQPGPQPVVVRPDSAPTPPPKIIVLQDADSYSIIDLHGSVPVVCFATRNSPGFEFITPIFGEPKAPGTPTTNNSHL